MKVAAEVPLEGTSPFELRVELSKSVSESVVKKALETGDLDFLLAEAPAQLPHQDSVIHHVKTRSAAPEEGHVS